MKTLNERLRTGPAADDSGAIALVVAILIVALLGVAAIVIDSGMLYAQRRSMQTAADSAALAGVMELPGSPSQAGVVADQYVDANPAGGSSPGREYTVSSTYGTNDTLRVHLTQPSLNMTLARFLGINSEPVGAKATAVISSPSGYGRGVMPFGIMSKEPSGTSPFGYVFNESVTLKQPAGQGEAGNFQFIDLVGGVGEPAGGAPDITGPLSQGGVAEPVFIGETYYTQTGINGVKVDTSLDTWIGSDSHSFSQICEVQPDGTVSITDYDCHRLVVCPIVEAVGPPASFNWSDVSGSKLIRIIGLSFFYIESWGHNGNESWVTGRFIRPLTPEDGLLWGPVDPYGAIGFRLID